MLLVTTTIVPFGTLMLALTSGVLVRKVADAATGVDSVIAIQAARYLPMPIPPLPSSCESIIQK